MEEIFTKSYVKIDGSPLKPRRKTIPECLKYYAETKPDGESLIFVSPNGGRESVTWSQLYEKSCVIARSFIKLGIRRHEIVAINMRCCPEWLYATFGAMMAGAIPAGISFTYTDGSDLIALMDKMKNCSLLIVDPGRDGINWDILRNLLDECHANGTVRSSSLPYLRYMLGIAFDNQQDASNVKSFRDLLQEEHCDIDLPEIDPNDISALYQTSGSTGVPKLVAHVHISSMKVVEAGLFEMLEDKYILFNDRPFNWAGGFPSSVLSGQTRVTFSGFCEVPKDRLSFMIDVIERERCSMVFALPPLMHELIKRQEKQIPAGLDRESDTPDKCTSSTEKAQDALPADWPVKGILTGGQPLTGRLAVCVGKACKFLLCIYGGTEFAAAAQAKITDPNEFSEYGCGKPVKYPGLEVKIIDEKGEIVPVNQRGEIHVRHDVLFKEFYNDPEKTRAVKTEDGWYKTDDIGRMTEHGELFVEGRKSNMIISGGFNVAPEILEQVMKNFPGIESVIIVPVPDDVYYQVLCACVIKKQGCNLTEADIRNRCQEYHADKPGLFTVLPKFYMFCEKFPETHSGKTSRRELERLALQQFKSVSNP